MAKYNVSFSTKFEAAVDARIGRALAAMEGMSACAGIINDPENAFKARVNHYGGTITKRSRLSDVGETRGGKRHIKLTTENVNIRIPERHFIDTPLNNDSYALREFEKQVAQIMSGGRLRSASKISGQPNASPSSIGQGGGVKDTLKMIADALADAQKNAVYAAQPPNAESTIKRKGFDAPLRETNDMVDSIKGWVQYERKEK